HALREAPEFRAKPAELLAELPDLTLCFGVALSQDSIRFDQALAHYAIRFGQALSQHAIRFGQIDRQIRDELLHLDVSHRLTLFPASRRGFPRPHSSIAVDQPLDVLRGRDFYHKRGAVGRGASLAVSSPPCPPSHPPGALSPARRRSTSPAITCRI